MTHRIDYQFMCLPSYRQKQLADERAQEFLQLLLLIIQQIVTLSKYGHDALDICHPVGNRYPAIYVASYGKKK